jgi:hypothetical protein
VDEQLRLVGRRVRCEIQLHSSSPPGRRPTPASFPGTAIESPAVLPQLSADPEARQASSELVRPTIPRGGVELPVRSGNGMVG